MGMLKEFKEFAVKGNVIDLAVGVIVGAGFGKITASLVKDMIMPPIGKLLGHVNFSNLYINLSDQSYASLSEAQKAGAATINYGLFINTVIDFTIVAFAVFLLVRQINKFRKEPQPKAPDTKDCPECLSAIPLQAKRCRYCTSPV